MEKSMITTTQAQTEALGERLAKHMFPGMFVALWGGLGAGKTAFARGVGAGLGIMDGVTSPTFTILQPHPEGSLPLYHFDVYRLSSKEELWDIGFDEYLNSSGVVLMEWPENVEQALPPERLDIQISGSGNQPREIRLVALGERYRELLVAWLQGEGGVR